MRSEAYAVLLRRLIAYFLVCNLVFQFLGTMGVIAWFSLNRSYIAEELCENRSRPELACLGQCILMKKLRQLEEPDSNQQQNERSAKVEWLALLPTSSLLLVSASVADNLNDLLPDYCFCYSYLFAQIPFIPPKTF